ncbi:MAG: hypothetical protein IJN92_04320 [Lachnospiraceae bacterium]|nr:hypothetical protein [Lachnospiraceae bacterium]
MDKKATGIIAYITLVGLIIAFCAGDKEGAKFHLNQALAIWIVNLALTVLGWIPVIGWILSLVGGIFVFVCWVMGLVYAIKEEEKEVPLIGKIQILK